MSYPNLKFKAWWVVHKVNLREHLHTPCTAGYKFEDEQADDVYQEEELPTTFTIDECVAPKRNPRNKKPHCELWIEEDSLIVIPMNFGV
jgi:hypothetical protein